MTSRLRNKLDNMEASGSNLNESFCQIGTPLPPLADTKKDEGEFVPVWKQEVRDEQGRRRLHGAFTGGFSAGYFNSVGSKEGWTPSTFISSRSSRAKKTQTAEDFMDEEDLADMREARVMETVEGFGGTAEELGGKGKGKGSGLSSALSSLIQPAPSSIGRTLLLKLGWRPGQGIGPRLSSRALARQSVKLGLPPPMIAGGEDEDMEAKKHTFAPRDRRLEVYEAKVGKEGLGFVGGVGKGLAASAGVKGPSMSAGFGFGIDDPDEDDADVYATAGPSSSRQRGGVGEEGMAFDMDVDEENDVGDVVLLGNGAAGRKGMGQGGGVKFRKPLVNKDIDNKRWHDGRPLIPGFVLDTSDVAQDKWFDFPPIPADWHPRPARVWNKVNRWDQKGKVKEAPTGLGMGVGRVQLTAEQRGERLGEEPIKAPLKSVFDYMSEKSKERLAQFAASTASSQSSTIPPPPSTTGPDLTQLIIPPLSPRTASAALHGFQPFGDDLPKQARYRSYLVSQTHNSPAPNPMLMPSSKIEEINREMEDFVKSAGIFKPMSFAMSSRFTTATASHLDTAQPVAGLHIPDPDKIDEWKDRAQKEQEVLEVLTPRQEAARAGMYGPLTRSREGWAPNKLLCKRFGVVDPYPDGLKGDGQAGEKTAGGVGVKPLADMAWMEKYTPVPAAGGAKAIEAAPTTPAVGLASGAGTEQEQERQPRTMAEVGMAEDGRQGREILTYVKPGMDIFKAIFEGESGDEDEDEEEVEASGKEKEKGREVGKVFGAANEALAAEVIGDRLSEPSFFPKPVFTSKATKRDREEEEDGDRPEKERKKEKKKEKKEKEKKKSRVLMSFDMGDEEGDGGEGVVVKVKQEKKKPKPEAGEEDEWVEKEVQVEASSARGAGRRKAEDYL